MAILLLLLIDPICFWDLRRRLRARSKFVSAVLPMLFLLAQKHARGHQSLR
jgi:hypothetical protein